MPVPELISTIRVSSCEVDSFGHVNNAVYLQYCERARNDYMIQCGLKFAHFEQWNAGPVLYQADLAFRRPAIVDDELCIRGELLPVGKTRFRIIHEFQRVSDRKEICRAHLAFAFVALDTGRPCRVPAEFLSAFGAGG